MRATIVGLGLAVVLGATGHAQEPPTVVELFTSQGCSSCPPADAFLTELVHQRHDVLPLAFQVTYWDYLGWRDRYSPEAATAPQRDYALRLGQDGVYTPEIVVDGAIGFVGSDRPQGLKAIVSAPHKTIPVSLEREGQTLLIKVGAGTGQARVLLVGFDTAHQTPIGRGENGGRTLAESNVVRSLTPVGPWSGTQVELRQKLPLAEDFAVPLQTEDGHIVGAGRLTS